MSSTAQSIDSKQGMSSTVERGEHHLLLTWLCFTGLLLFALFIGWQENLLLQVYATDRSRISLLITLIYVIVTLHCAMRIWNLSHESNQVRSICRYIHNNRNTDLAIENDETRLAGYGPMPESIMKEYLHDLILQRKYNQQIDSEDQGPTRDLIEVYSARLKGPQEIGWFATDIMLKLGLLGTIIGFMMMLGSVANVTDFDVTTMQKILQLMSSGMGTALFTTMTGLVASMLAATQYYMLDRSADSMLESMQHISEVRLKPLLQQQFSKQ